MKTTATQNNFTAGEISPKSYGRFDLAKYVNACKTLLNWLIDQVGGALFRPGTQFVSEVKTSAKATRIIPFQVSTTQAYIVEIGDLYMRFYANQAQVVSGGAAVEITTPYTPAQIFDLNYAQENDVMYITHSSHKSRKLQRTSAVVFTLTEVPFVRGPFLDSNITATTITPSSDTGATTLTASTGIFVATHSGALWRVKSGVVRITSVSTAQIVIGTVQAEPDGSAGNLATGPAATTDWSEGAFSDYRGWPATVCFHEQRLFYAATTHQSQNIWGSYVGAYDDFETGSDDADAVTFKVASLELNAIKWLISTPRALSIGTFGGTFSARGNAGIITPSDIDIKLDTNYGASALRPNTIGAYIYYVQRNLNRLRELGYSLELDGQDADDANLLADHILRDGAGAKDIAHQQAPNDRIWIVRNDGQIAVLTRNVKQDVVGWSRLSAGRDSRGSGVFESIAIIPQENDEDQVWVVVKRYINGGYVRYVEYFSDEDFVDDWDAVRLDSSLTLDNPITMSAASTANPVVITFSGASFAEAQQIKIDNVVGMTQLNGNFYKVSAAGATSFRITDLDDNLIDGSGFDDYISGGEIRSMVTAISGLDHLEGETVSVAVDAGLPADQQTFKVVSGAINLIRKAAVVHAGLPYNGDLQLLKLSDGSAQGTGQTKKRKIYLSTVRVHRSLGLEIGVDEDNPHTVFFGNVNDPLGEPPAMITGDVAKHFKSGWSSDDEIFIRQSDPLPLNILCIVIKSEVSES